MRLILDVLRYHETHYSFIDAMMQIACGDVDVAIGTDQAGSVRIPAAFSGIGRWHMDMVSIDL